MRKLLASVVFLALTSSGVTAGPDLRPRVTLAGGAQLGFSDHPDDGGVGAGLQFRTELQLWWMILGGSVGTGGYPSSEAGAPVHATSAALHLGVAPSLYRHQGRSRLHELRALAAIELGRHNYSPNGRESPSFNFFNESTTYRGGRRAVGFAGGRAGLSYARTGPEGGLVFALEAVYRRDRHTVDLAYEQTSCGGLFSDGCTTAQGMTTAGGHELSMIASVGVVIGR